MAILGAGKPVGRPLKYQTAEELQVLIDAYFADCAEKDEPLTIYGLARACALTREQLLKYEGRQEFVDTIKDARDYVRDYVEKRLMSNGQAAGPIFWLKNNGGWADKQEVEVTGSVGVTVNIEGWAADSGPDGADSA